MYPYLPDALAQLRGVKVSVVEDSTDYEDLVHSLRYADALVLLPPAGFSFRAGLLLGLASTYGVPVYAQVHANTLRSDRSVLSGSVAFVATELRVVVSALAEYLAYPLDSMEAMCCLARQKLSVEKILF